MKKLLYVFGIFTVLFAFVGTAPVGSAAAYHPFPVLVTLPSTENILYDRCLPFPTPPFLGDVLPKPCLPKPYIPKENPVCELISCPSKSSRPTRPTYGRPTRPTSGQQSSRTYVPAKPTTRTYIPAQPTPGPAPTPTPTPTPTPNPNPPSPGPCFGSYPTDIDGHWAEIYIRRLYDLCIVEGYGDGLFKPNQNVTRAELTKMALYAAGIPAKEGCYDADCGSPFMDLDMWQGPWIRSAFDHGIVQGRAPNRFEPNRPITRAEATKVILASFGFEPLPVNDSFFNDVHGWSVGWIERAHELGIVQGIGNGNFDPNRPITRAESAKIVAKTMEYWNTHINQSYSYLEEYLDEDQDSSYQTSAQVKTRKVYPMKSPSSAQVKTRTVYPMKSPSSAQVKTRTTYPMKPFNNSAQVKTRTTYPMNTNSFKTSGKNVYPTNTTKVTTRKVYPMKTNTSNSAKVSSSKTYPVKSSNTAQVKTRKTYPMKTNVSNSTKVAPQKVSSPNVKPAKVTPRKTYPMNVNKSSSAQTKTRTVTPQKPASSAQVKTRTVYPMKSPNSAQTKTSNKTSPVRGFDNSFNKNLRYFGFGSLWNFSF